MTDQTAEQTNRREWTQYEVFVRSNRGLSHVHAGSLHAPDDTMALRNARDLYTCLLYTSPSPRDRQKSRMPSSA